MSLGTLPLGSGALGAGGGAAAALPPSTNQNLRASGMHFCTTVYPAPDGTISAGDRRHVAWLYPHTAAAADLSIGTAIACAEVAAGAAIAIDAGPAAGAGITVDAGPAAGGAIGCS